MAINALHSGRSLAAVQHIPASRSPLLCLQPALRCYLERKYIEYRADQTTKYPPFPSRRRGAQVSSRLDRELYRRYAARKFIK